MQQKGQSYSHLKALLSKKKEQRFYQHLSTLLFHKKPQDGLHLNSLDFMDLNNNPYIQIQALHQLIEWGKGSCSKTLVVEQIELQYQLEKKLSTLLKRDHCFVYQSNATVQQNLITSFIDTKTLLIIDEDFAYRSTYLKHKHSVIVKRNDLKDLESILKKHRQFVAKIFIGESISSFTGTVLQVNDICTVCKKYDTLTFIDDSNSISVAGASSMGLCSNHPNVDIVTGSYAKSIGTYACFLATNEFLSDYFSHVNQAIDSFHLLSPASLALLNASIALIPHMQLERKRLQNLSEKLKKELKLLEFHVEKSHFNIISLSFRNEQRALKLSYALTKARIYHITFGSTLHNKHCTHLRFILNCNHTNMDIKHLLQTLEQTSDALMIQIV